MATLRDPALSGLVLSEREQKVLEAVVNEHIESSEPVGSLALAERMALSSATIRNVMSVLGERGLIDKPHASAGRVPTALGLRYYVDTMLQWREPDDAEQREIASRLQEARSLDKAMEEAGRVLARLSQKACLVRAPKPRAVRLRQIELVRLRDDALLVILVTVDGSVQNRVLAPRPEGLGGIAPTPLPDPDALARMSRYLSELVAGRTLAEVRSVLEREIQAAREEHKRLEEAALRLGSAAIAGGEEPESAVMVEGSRHLLEGNDGKDVRRLAEVLSVLEERTRLLALLDRADEAPGVRIFIGDENPLKELADLSVVTSTYGAGEEVVGTLGVIGPVHMDYRRVVPLVEFTARMVSELLR